MVFNLFPKATIEKIAVIKGTNVNNVLVFNDVVVFSDSKRPIKKPKMHYPRKRTDI